jgi:mannosyltransferase
MRTGTLLAGVLLVAALVRLDGVATRSLGLDEAVTWEAATRPTLAEAATHEVNQPPVWYATAWAAVAAFGDSVAAMRAPSLLLGVLSVALLYLLARRCLREDAGRGAALVVAALGALNPLWVAQSQEARPYAALLAASLGASLLYLRWLDGGRRRDLLGYAAVAVVALHTQYVAAAVLAAHGLHALALGVRSGPARSRAWGAIAALAVAAAAWLPWLLHALGVGLTYWTAEDPRVAMHTAESVFRAGAGPGIAAKRSGLRAEAARLVAPALAWLGSLLVAAWRGPRGLRRPGFVAASAVVPVAALALGSLRGTFVHERYLVTVAGFLLVAIGAAAASLPRRAGGALVVGVALLEVAGSLAHLHPEVPAVRTALSGPYADHVRSGGDWPAAYAWLSERAGRSDVILVASPLLERTWAYYDRGRLGAVLPGRAAPAADYRRLVEAGRVFVVTAADEGEAAPGGLPDGLGMSVRETARFPSWSRNAVRIDVRRR